MMERQQILATMGELKLFGMKAAYDEIIKVAVKRTHEPQQIVGDLLQAEISEKQARSIRYQMTIAKLPLAKDIAEFAFGGTPINEGLVRDLAWRRVPGPSAQRRAGRWYRHGQDPSRHRDRPGLHPGRGNEPGSTTWSTSSIGSKPRLVPAGKAHRGPSRPARPRGVGRTRLPAVRAAGRAVAVPPDQPSLRDHLDRGHHQPRLRRMAGGVCRRRQDDHGAARSAHPPL